MKTEQKSTGLNEIDIHQLLAEVISAKWLIAATVVVFFVLGSLYAIATKPKYQTSALIQMNQKNNSISSLSSLASLVGNMSSVQEQASPAMIESTLLQSRYILAPVIKALNLDIAASQHHFPILGHFAAKTPGAIVVKTLEVPPSLLQERLKVIKDSSTTYSVYGLDGNLLVKGTLGKLNTSKQAPDFKINITQLKGKNGTRYNLEKLRLEYALLAMKNAFSVNTNNPTNMPSTDTGVLNLTFTSKSPTAAVTTLNTILTTAYNLGIKQQSLEAEHIITFLNKQIPQVKKQLQTAENALSSYQTKSGNFGVSIQSQVLLQQIVSVNQQLEQLKLKRTELLQLYTANHPYVQTINKKIDVVQNEMDGLKARVRNLPEADKTAVTLVRDVKTKNQLYLLLLGKLQQMQVLKAGVISNMKILDTAYTPPKELPVHRGLILIVSLILGFLVGLSAVITKVLFRNGVQDPDIIEENFGVSVNAIIPHSKNQEKISQAINKAVIKKPRILAQEVADDMSIEAIRSLRTNLQISMMERSSNIICVSGLTPGIGKSFVSLNLAYTLAKTSKDILLIDIDIRKGKIHRSFGIDPAPGITDYLKKEVKLHDAIIHNYTGLSNLHFIPRGSIHKNPAELLQSENMKNLLEELKKEYSTIIIDTPPILAVSDPIHIMKEADINLLLLSAGQHTMREINQAFNLLKVNDIKVDGAIFNFAKNTTARSYYYYTGYSYKSYAAYTNNDDETKT